jgi:acylphosphatase
MMKRAIIIVKGDVQRVGYRDRVENIARKLGVTGFVENLKPYDVRIVAEGEKGNLEKFIQQIKIRDDPLIEVSDISVEYKEPTGEFEYFEIKRGSHEEEDAERWDAAAGYLKTLINKSEGMRKDLGEKIDGSCKHLGEKIDGSCKHLGEKIDESCKHLGEKIDSGNELLKGETRAFRQDTMQRFDIIDIKYGKIAENMEKAIQAINRTCTNTERLLEKTERDRKDFRYSIEKLANAIMSKK